MIVSASRRTDIPAFHMDWLTARVREGFACSQNPRNPRQIRRVELNPDSTQLVLWTKNAAPMLQYLPVLEPFAYYVQYTLTPYGAEIEPGLPDRQRRVDTFRRLSDILGPHRVVWRCDPFLWGSGISTEWLTDQYGSLAQALSGWTETCIISFVDLYRCMQRRFSSQGLRPGTAEEKTQIALAVQRISQDCGMQAAACCESGPGGVLPPAHCIDAGLLSRLAGTSLPAAKDRSQRPHCLCSSSVDIGAYDTCRHGCVYCYAQHHKTVPAAEEIRCDPASPLLLRAGSQP